MRAGTRSAAAAAVATGLALAALASVIAPARAIVGGEVVPEGQVPGWFADLSIGPFSCGGSLVSDKCVLTAAHCLYDMGTGLELPTRGGSPSYMSYPDWNLWDKSTLTQAALQAPIGSAPMPDAPVGRLTNPYGNVEVGVGGKIVTGTSAIHPYYFEFRTEGKCERFLKKKGCNRARGCSWDGNLCVPSGAVKSGWASVIMNDIALVILDDAQPDVEKVTLSDAGFAGQRSTLIGNGVALPQQGEASTDDYGREITPTWADFCSGILSGEGPLANGIIAMPKRKRWLAKKWCTPGDPAYLNPGEASVEHKVTVNIPDPRKIGESPPVETSVVKAVVDAAFGASARTVTVDVAGFDGSVPTNVKQTLDYAEEFQLSANFSIYDVTVEAVVFNSDAATGGDSMKNAVDAGTPYYPFEINLDSTIDAYKATSTKWTDWLERSSPEACSEWYGKLITEDSWSANGDMIPILPYETAFDTMVCAAQTRSLFRQSSRVPNGDCQGDSGGPIVSGTRTSLGAQYGVVSFGGGPDYKKETSLEESNLCGGLAAICKCGRKIVPCDSPACPSADPEEPVWSPGPWKRNPPVFSGWKFTKQAQNAYANVAHFKNWLKEQESVCGEMKWSSEA